MHVVPRCPTTFQNSQWPGVGLLVVDVVVVVVVVVVMVDVVVVSMHSPHNTKQRLR